MHLPTLCDRIAWLLAAVIVAGVTACNNPLALPPAVFENTVDTVTLHAITGTDIALPSAFDIISSALARTDRAQPFDFAFDIDASGAPVAIPSGLLGLSTDPGLLLWEAPFDSLVPAPDEGYVTDSSITFAVGTVLIGRSRFSSQDCALLGSLPRYGKFRVLAIDLQARSVAVEYLINRNCGYRNLEPGFPTS